MTAKPPLSYRDAGVDIDAGAALVERIKPAVASTLRPGVLTGLGGFGGLFELPMDRYRRPVLVSGTDGVGTKLRLALDLGKLDTVGIDLVAMCVNDVLVLGAEPLFFLDYYATGRLDVEAASAVIGGIAAGCAEAGCALIGGETAELPGMYHGGDFDLAGFCVGIVERDAILDGSRIEAGSVLLGLASSGPHSNGFSLLRRILERADPETRVLSDGRAVAEAALTPTRIYVRSVLATLAEVPLQGLAHITGGGLLDNVPRVLPEGLQARIDPTSWTRPELFTWLQREGAVSEEEMFRTFNCGIGMVVVVSPAQADRAAAHLTAAGETVYRIGRVEAGDAGVVLAT
ncbi:MAG: phosphoribosylformylglycinamidine cyclo-ligase [Gammaproteobacteria bacterium]|nr:MAG: phosphoribosylformylglycinamidine cyclo-ligase [Gammaproteobacteria bacterium]